MHDIGKTVQIAADKSDNIVSIAIYGNIMETIQFIYRQTGFIISTLEMHGVAFFPAKNVTDCNQIW